jgi:lysozyme
MNGKLSAMLKMHEGLRLKPYLCTAGRTTIGYGRNLDDKGISADEAETLLANDIADVTESLARALPWTSQLDPVRYAVLVDMCFNLGLSRLLGFKKMIGHAQAGRYVDAANEMLDSVWARQVGGRATRLAWMMTKGEWAKDIA